MPPSLSRTEREAGREREAGGTREAKQARLGTRQARLGTRQAEGAPRGEAGAPRYEAGRRRACFASRVSASSRTSAQRPFRVLYGP
jgi:hypothetical protein